MDPFCGSGTIGIEAAMIGRHQAPGLKRTFASEAWSLLPQTAWKQAWEEAQEAILPHLEARILCSDIDGRALRTARANAEQAGVTEDVAFQTLPAAEIRSKKKYGCIITNPPYGVRLGETKEAEALYREMGRTFAALDTWSFYVLTAHESFERLFGRRADRKRKLYNGRMKVEYYQFYGPRPPKRTSDVDRTAEAAENP
jgi:putative N6-adenine-specific DNA methylase